MAKKSPPTGAPAEVGRLKKKAHGKPKRRKRLERQLAGLASTEAKLVRQLAKIRAKAAQIEARLTALEGSDEVKLELVLDPTSTSGPAGYCMRERRTVRISEPVLFTYPSGRLAVRGTCPSCGARVVALAARPRANH